MSYSVLWTLLPNGINPQNGRARLTLVASPRTIAGQKVLGDSPLMRWPEIAAGMRDIHIIEAGTDDRVSATIVSPAPQQDLWSRLFTATGPVVPFDTTETPILQTMESAHSFKAAVDAVYDLYAEALRTTPTEALSRVHPLVQRVAALDTLSLAAAPAAGAARVRTDDVEALLDPAQLDATRLQRATDLLRERGAADAAAMAPLAVINRRLARRTSGGARQRAVASSVKAIRSVEEAEFHQVIGMLIEHPALALRLGLCLALEIPAFTGERIIRAVGPNDQPFNGPVPLPQPWSHVVCDPAAGRFVMQTQPDAPANATEIVHGMLDLRPDPGHGKYALTDMDVLAAAQQLQGMASALRQGHVNPVSLPGLRNGGLTLAQVDRRARTLAHVLQRNARFDGGSGEIAGAPVLYADDVTTGYRVDVSTDGGPFQSLMRRVITYRIGANDRSGLTVHDEGTIEAGTAVEQRAADGTLRLTVGEEMLSWSGWGLAVPRPGPVAREDGPSVGTEVVPAQPLPGYPLTTEVTPEPGSLPRLRFGRTYRLRVRAVDLAGNAIEPEACDPALVSPPLLYRRLERTQAPVLVPRRAYGLGESHTRLIVRSNGEGQVLGLPCERHVLPPAVSYQLAELHGVFDAAMGPESPARAAARARLLAIARRQDATVHDPVVLGPNGEPVPAPGITVARMDPASTEPLATLPLSRGATLPAGQYVHHDTETMRAPYLTDPAVAGAAFQGLPPTGGIPQKAPVTVPYGAKAWPEAEPFRLVVKAGPTASTTIERALDGRPQLVVTVPPATELTTVLSSTLTAAAVQQMDPQGLAPTTAAQQGQVHLLSQMQPVTIVHAVQKPLVAPTLAVSLVDRPATGNTWVRLAGQVSTHLPSTSRVDLEASWTEIVDRGVGPVTFEPRTTIVGSVVLDTQDATRGFDVKQQFGDAKRRQVTYAAAGTTRFTDCFPTPAPGEQRLFQRVGPGHVVDVFSTHRPPPVDVHSAIPLWRWTRAMQGGVYRSTRLFTGVRVYLRRKWYITGTGEMLGVVTHASHSTAVTMRTTDDADLFTRWGEDPYEASQDNPVSSQSEWTSDVIANKAFVHMLTHLAGNTTDPAQPVFAIAALPVNFDESRGLWYADIELAQQLVTGFAHDWPFVRFALVRYQPGTVTKPTDTVDRRASSVVLTDFVQLARGRELEARRVDPTTVTVTLSPQNAERLTTATAHFQRRVFDPQASGAAAPDVCIDVLESATTLQAIPGFSNLTGQVRAHIDATAFRAGRIVVEEHQEGYVVAGVEATAKRVVYRDLIECTVFDRPDGPIP